MASRDRVPVDVVGRRRSPLAPTRATPGATPSGRIGSTLAEVCTSVAAQQQRGVDAVALEQREQHVAGRVGADRARAADLRAELGQHERGAAGRAGRGDADLLHQRAALALGDRLDRAHEHVEHVHAHARWPSLRRLRVVP